MASVKNITDIFYSYAYSRKLMPGPGILPDILFITLHILILLTISLIICNIN